jgi:hypothetical protein
MLKVEKVLGIAATSQTSMGCKRVLTVCTQPLEHLEQSGCTAAQSLPVAFHVDRGFKPAKTLIFEKFQHFSSTSVPSQF